MTLADKLTLVTASSRGLGLACATKLATEGCRVVISARDFATLQAAAAKIGAHAAIQADLAVAADVARLTADAITRLGGLDILVVNSGHIPYGGITELSDTQWQDAFELLLMSAVRLVRAAVPAMRERGGGDIVFIGSSSVRQPPQHLLLSSVMRLGVVGLAKSLSLELAGDNIRVNVVAPGYFASGRVAQRIADQVAAGTPREAAERAVAGDNPMQRLGTPEELAELVAFVASRRAGFLNGAHLTIDGGATGFPL